MKKKEKQTIIDRPHLKKVTQVRSLFSGPSGGGVGWLVGSRVGWLVGLK